jgi:hypothetical protein
MKTTLVEKIVNGTPDLKYYAFDWDDNIVHMPTKIYTVDEDGDEVGISTEDFAILRERIGNEPFTYKGQTIVGYAEEPFRDFSVKGDKQFLIDSLRAKPGPAWKDFVEAINNGSIFAIITARGHNPNTLKQAVYNMILRNYEGLDKDELIKNLKKYREFAGEEEMSEVELVKSYLEMNKYHPVSYGEDSGASKPEDLKVSAMEDFVLYVKAMAALLHKKAFLKKDMGFKFSPEPVPVPTIGFSDDDERNVEVMKKHFEKLDEPIKTYSTKGGIKKEY